MASTINTGSIDTAFPIAGQDNDSQGFRDNFTNINDNFVTAKDEITALQDEIATVAIPVTVPVSAKGSPGDRRGMMASDASYMYMCILDYTNGVDDIWVRSAASAW
jgi:hypothetical protein